MLATRNMLTFGSLQKEGRLLPIGNLCYSTAAPHLLVSFILEARCEYFRIVFSSGMAESNAVNEESAPAMVDIVVPDSFVGLLRFLIYLYTDILPDGSDGALLEDLMSADRYQVG